MKELVIISGKGGTGKTSIAASLAVLAGDAVVADCDVDAADLPLVLAPRVRRREEFRSGHQAIIREADCIRCGACLEACRFGAVVGVAAAAPPSCNECDICERSCAVRNNYIVHEMCLATGRAEATAFAIDALRCEGCGVCVHQCPVGAIDLSERRRGEWFVSETRCGPLVHARLDPAGENSGRLVSLVRAQARQVAKSAGRDLVIIDGAPGNGCPVIASLTGATAALIVTEPTLSGRHDCDRVAAVARHLGVPTCICVNKWDLNPEITREMEDAAREAGIPAVGRVRYDRAVTAAQMAGKTIVEHSAEGAAADVRAVWQSVRDRLLGTAAPPSAAAEAARHREPVARSSRGGPAAQALETVERVSAGTPIATAHTTQEPTNPQESKGMKIAVPVESGHLSPHFGHCVEFVLYDIDPIKKTTLARTLHRAPPHEPGVLPRWLHGLGANIVLTGGMGQRARQLFAEQGIEVVIGAPPDPVDQVVAEYLAGTLITGANPCDH